MSLPNYLATIKSAGMYRFTFDKSQLPPAAAETMRLVVGYSDKGPFNNPVYIENKQDFITLFGGINKKLERKGVFFHRMALQALSSGPILAMNLKPFEERGENGTVEQVDYISFNVCGSHDANLEEIMLPDATGNPTVPSGKKKHKSTHDSATSDFTVNGFESIKAKMDVRHLFDRDRFWKLDADLLPEKISSNGSNTTNNYISIAATDAIERSCSIFFRKCHDNSVKQYNITIRDWYKLLGENIPEYLEGYEDTNLKDYFAEIYVFRGKFTDAIIKGDGVLAPYFGNDGGLKTDYTNAFTEPTDALAALASDANSNFIGVYRGCLLPYFKDQLGTYVSLDIVFNQDTDNHKMIMKLDDKQIEKQFPEAAPGEGTENSLNHWPTTGWNQNNTDINAALKPTYISGYTYNTITKTSTASEIYTKSLAVLSDKGIYTALTNHVDSEYHYIIDTYAHLVADPEDESRINVIKSKDYIAAIAKAKDNCLAIMNAPSKNDLLKVISNFKMESFEKGEYTNYFRLPSEATGASYCAYYTPLVLGDKALKTVVPSAAIVSNNFMEKWKSRQPYYIVAGPTHGRMEADGLIGPDYNYSREDLDVFEPMGINCMVYVPRKGTYINSNQTAKQVPVTALSKVHVRELVIYLQDEIEAMMQNYQWELNTQTLRDTIKTKADAILEKIKANGGVYDYLNVCDGSNNTAEMIDNEMIILDTSIEPARGAGKMVQRLTIHKTGGISALTK